MEGPRGEEGEGGRTDDINKLEKGPTSFCKNISATATLKTAVNHFSVGLDKSFMKEHQEK